jgi:hypothetical protein
MDISNSLNSFLSQITSAEGNCPKVFQQVLAWIDSTPFPPPSQLLVTLLRHALPFCVNDMPGHSVILQFFSDLFNRASSSICSGSDSLFWVLRSLSESLKQSPENAQSVFSLSNLRPLLNYSTGLETLERFRFLDFLYSLLHECPFSLEAIARLFEVLEKSTSSVTAGSLRVIDDGALERVLHQAHETAQSTECRRKLYDFLLFCLRSEYLKKQLLAARLLCAASEREPGRPVFQGWVRTSNLLSFLLERDLHEEVISRFSGYLPDFIPENSGEELHSNLHKLWDRFVLAQPFHRKSIAELITGIFSRLYPEQITSFLEFLFRAAQDSADAIDFLRQLAIQTHNIDISLSILPVLLNLRRCPSQLSSAFSALLKLSTSAVPQVLRESLMSILRVEFHGDSPHPSTVSLIRRLAESDPMYRFDPITEFLGDLNRATSFPHVFGLMKLFLVRSGHLLTPADMPGLFSLVAPHAAAWSRIAKFAGGPAELLPPACASAFLECLDDFDFLLMPPEMSESVSRLMSLFSFPPPGLSYVLRGCTEQGSQAAAMIITRTLVLDWR